MSYKYNDAYHKIKIRVNLYQTKIIGKQKEVTT